LRRNKRQEWHNLCAHTESIHESARLYKIVGFSPTITLGMLRRPDVQWTATLEEAYMHLLETHFPGCKLMEEAHQDSSTRWSFKFHRQEVDHIVTEDHIQWAISTMAPFKSPGQDDIYPFCFLLQKGLQSLLYPLCKIYRASIRLWYIPKLWREARVAFLPKPGKDDYTNAKAYRHTGLFV